MSTIKCPSPSSASTFLFMPCIMSYSCFLCHRFWQSGGNLDRFGIHKEIEHCKRHQRESGDDEEGQRPVAGGGHEKAGSEWTKNAGEVARAIHHAGDRTNRLRVKFQRNGPKAAASNIPKEQIGGQESDCYAWPRHQYGGDHKRHS